MSPTIALCVFCRIDNSSLARISLNHQGSGPWSEILLVDLYFQRKNPAALLRIKHLTLMDGEKDPVAFAAEQSSSDYLFFLEAGEQVRISGKFDEEGVKGPYCYVPFSRSEEGWEPFFSLRLFHRGICLGKKEGKAEASFLVKPFAVSRAYPYSSFILRDPPLEGPEILSLYLRGEKARCQGNHKKGVDYFNRACLAAHQPQLKRFFSYKRLASLVWWGQGANTLSRLARAEKDFPFPVEFAYLRGEVFLALRRYQDALACFIRAGEALRKITGSLPWAPDDFVITTAKAKALAALGQSEKALKAATHALACCPGYYPALRILASAALKHCPDPRGPRLLFRHTSALLQGRYAVLARVFLEHRRFTEALTWIHSGLRESPGNPELLYLEASLCLKKGQLSKGLVLLREIPRGSRYFREAFFMGCLCLWYLKDFKGALLVIGSAVSEKGLPPEEVEFCRRLHYHVMHKAGKPGLMAFAPLLQKNGPLFFKVLELSLDLGLKDIYLVLLGLAKTREQGRNLLKIAKLLARREEKGLAVSFFNRALEKEAYDNESLLYLGKMALEEGLYTEARELFTLALQTYPQDLSVHLAYTRSLLQEACMKLQKAPPDKVLEKARAGILDTLANLEGLELNI